MKKLTNLMILLLFLCSCAVYNIQTTYDKFDGNLIHRMKGNILGGGSGIELNIQRVATKKGAVRYTLIINYRGRGWIFIEKGESLVFLADGLRIGLVGNGSFRHRNILSGRWVEEMAWYIISYEDLRKIALANDVKVRISGSKYFIERYLTSQNLKNFRRFIEEYGLY